MRISMCVTTKSFGTTKSLIPPLLNLTSGENAGCVVIAIWRENLPM